MTKSGWIGKFLLGVGILVPIIGFAISAYLASSDQSVAIFSGEKAPQEEYVLTAADFPEPSQTGNQEGYRVPDFTLTLEDGSTITSTNLIEAGQPTFLFFWATY